MVKPILSDNMEKAPTESNLSITSNDINIELSKEFLVELRKNIYHGTYNEDVVDHIAKKGDEKITTWEELVEKFFCRFYPESYDGEDEMLDEGENWGIDPLEFLSNVNTSFKNHIEQWTERTQKAYDVRDIEKENGHGQIKRKDNDKDDKRPHKKICKTEKFEAIKYSLGPNEEYLAIRRCEYDIWERNEGLWCSRSTYKSFRKRTMDENYTHE
ncbi:hypothetical protein Tco_1221603 [Tanacetum coccineum]